MRTNLSRFTVSFSDHAWSQQSQDDLFPQAWEVGDYLKGYAARFLDDDVLRLSSRVVRTTRDTAAAGRTWTVEWVDNKDTHSESFDYLVVASGFFSRPHIPAIAGLDSFPPDRVLHSSALNSRTSEHLLRSSGPGDNKIVVVGGSMSGAEAAASLALDLSTSTASKTQTQAKTKTTVHHISPRPFWAVPTYLPANDQPGSFLPLDIVMYDLARRPPGDIQYALGPLTPERANVVHKYFSALLGSDQSDVADALALGAEEDMHSAPWVAVTEHYAEFARAGDITPSLGRVVGVHWTDDDDAKKNGVVEVESRNGRKKSIDHVAAIVLATGFTPFESLSFLPADVLAALEYCDTDAVFPLVLDEKGVWNPGVLPDLGFVGMYRGPYWGVMEMQARALAQKWDQADTNTRIDSTTTTTTTTNKLRDLRTSPSPSRLRAQFPMGDYVGLIETFARELGIPRVSLSRDVNDRSGPAVPARYFMPPYPNPETSLDGNTTSLDGNTIAALQTLLQPSSAPRQRALCNAVLRALHGTWRYERVSSSAATAHGQASIRLRKVRDASAGFRMEYVYDEGGAAAATFSISGDSIYVAREDGVQRRLDFVSVEEKGEQYRHVAREAGKDVAREAGKDVAREAANDVSREYVFEMRGVAMAAWEERLGRLVTRYARHTTGL
jgi:Pyridine nucleotide-disulphide oxidoreductase